MDPLTGEVNTDEDFDEFGNLTPEAAAAAAVTDAPLTRRRLPRVVLGSSPTAVRRVLRVYAGCTPILPDATLATLRQRGGSALAEPRSLAVLARRMKTSSRLASARIVRAQRVLIDRERRTGCASRTAPVKQQAASAGKIEVKDSSAVADDGSVMVATKVATQAKPVAIAELLPGPKTPAWIIIPLVLLVGVLIALVGREVWNSLATVNQIPSPLDWSRRRRDRR